MWILTYGELWVRVGERLYFGKERCSLLWWEYAVDQTLSFRGNRVAYALYLSHYARHISLVFRVFRPVFGVVARPNFELPRMVLPRYVVGLLNSRLRRARCGNWEIGRSSTGRSKKPVLYLQLSRYPPHTQTSRRAGASSPVGLELGAWLLQISVMRTATAIRGPRTLRRSLQTKRNNRMETDCQWDITHWV